MAGYIQGLKIFTNSPIPTFEADIFHKSLSRAISNSKHFEGKIFMNGYEKPPPLKKLAIQW